MRKIRLYKQTAIKFARLGRNLKVNSIELYLHGSKHQNWNLKHTENRATLILLNIIFNQKHMK